MASNGFRISAIPAEITCLLVLLCAITISIPSTDSQNTGNSPTFPECSRTLMVLVPCEPFVQGMSTFPSLSCCSNLQELLGEDKDLRCFCFLLNVPTFPFNRALALQLPSLCRINEETTSTCSGIPQPEPSPLTPTSSPAPQQTFHSSPNSTPADSPVVTVIPKSSIMGFSFKNSGEKLGAEIEIHVGMFSLLVVTAILVFAGRM